MDFFQRASTIVHWLRFREDLHGMITVNSCMISCLLA